MKQAARELTNCEDGFLNGKQRLIMDRDTKFCESFRSLLSKKSFPWNIHCLTALRKDSSSKKIILDRHSNLMVLMNRSKFAVQNWTPRRQGKRGDPLILENLLESWAEITIAVMQQVLLLGRQL